MDSACWYLAQYPKGVMAKSGVRWSMFMLKSRKRRKSLCSTSISFRGVINIFSKRTTAWGEIVLTAGQFTPYPAVNENLKCYNFFLPLILDRFAWSYSDSEHSVPLDDSVWSCRLCFLFQVIPLYPEYLNRFTCHMLWRYHWIWQVRVSGN